MDNKLTIYSKTNKVEKTMKKEEYWEKISKQICPVCNTKMIYHNHNLFCPNKENCDFYILYSEHKKIKKHYEYKEDDED